MLRPYAILLPLLILVQSVKAAPPPGYQPSGTQWFPCSVVRYSDPLKLSGTVGAIHMRLLPGGRYHGFFGQVEPGVGGGKLTAGWRYGRNMFLPVYSIGASVSVLRTWGDPLGDVPSGQTYLGGEILGGFLGIWVNAGAFKRVYGEEGNDTIYTLGAGAGI